MIIIRYILLFVFLIANIYVPISFHYTMEINFLLLLLLAIGYRSKTVAFDRSAVSIALALLFYSFFITYFGTGTFSLDVPLNYIYYLICFISYPFIVDYFISKKIDVLASISFVLSIHCVVILLEVISPEFSAMKSMLFEYNRDDIEKVLFLDYRKMGLASGFDVAGFYATLSALLSFLLFYTRGKLFYFLLFCISASSSMMTSRTGMLLTFLGLASCVFLYKNHTQKSFIIKTIKVTSIAAIIVVGVGFVLPLVGAEFFGFSKSGFVSDVHDNYTDTSVEVLTGEHTSLLYALSIDELMFGTGQVFRRAKSYVNYSTDIGYIRQVFETGLLGLSLMLLFLYRNWKTLRKFNNICVKRCNKDNTIAMLYFYYLLALICLLLMNYKNYFIFDRGKFEIYCLIYFILLNLYHNSMNKIANETNK